MEINYTNFILATPSAKQVPSRELAGTLQAAACKEDKRKWRVSICPARFRPWRAFRGRDVNHNVLLGHKMTKRGRAPGSGPRSPRDARSSCQRPGNCMHTAVGSRGDRGTHGSRTTATEDGPNPRRLSEAESKADRLSGTNKTRRCDGSTLCAEFMWLPLRRFEILGFNYGDTGRSWVLFCLSVFAQ